MNYKKSLVALAISGNLVGCSLLGNSGETGYSVKPIILADGTTVCCEVEVQNTKDYDKFDLEIEKKADGSLKLSLKEKGVSSSDPAAVAAQNQSKLIDAVGALIPKTGN